MTIELLAAKVENVRAEYRSVQTSWERERAELAETVSKCLAAEEAQKAAQTVAQELQQRAHSQIAGVVSRCLEAVFEEPYEFIINFEQKRGRTEASLLFRREGVDVDPMTAAGGGVVDVAAFALRLACLNLSRPAKRPTMILDEPFKFLSAEYRCRIRELLETLAEEMDVQVIMVTHIDEIKTGKILEVGL